MTVNEQGFSYFGQTASFATMHEKESVVGPIFEESLGIKVVLAGIDTDQFGTFSGDVARTLSPLDTAIAKAKAAIEQTGSLLAIASEGTIGPHPLLPISSFDREIMVFIDTSRDLIIHESVGSSEVVVAQKVCLPGDDLESFLIQADFPNHGLIVRATDSATERFVKGITSRLELTAAIGELSVAGSVVVESDLRANFNPSRMRVIAQCAKLLVSRIASQCPDCKAPGWGSIEPIFGVPCQDCDEPIDTVVFADRMGCVKCDHVLVLKRSDTSAEARFCSSCNP